MEELEEKHIIEAGFEQEMIKQYNATYSTGWFEVKTSRYLRYDTEPKAYVEYGISAYFGRIGAMQWKLTNTSDLERFTNKTIPIFCDLK